MPWLCESWHSRERRRSRETRHSRESGNLGTFATGRLALDGQPWTATSRSGSGTSSGGMMEAQWIPAFAGMTGGWECRWVGGSDGWAGTVGGNREGWGWRKDEKALAPLAQGYGRESRSVCMASQIRHSRERCDSHGRWHSRGCRGSARAGIPARGVVPAKPVIPAKAGI